MQISFWGQTLPQLQQFFAARGENPAKAALVYESIYRRGQRDFAALIWLKEPLRRALDEHFSLALPQVIARADDGESSKFLLRQADGHAVEAVLMRRRYGIFLCLSTQVGCNMACAFCESGRQKKQRDLTAAEMLAQVLAVEEASGEKVTNLVLMGIGEPFDNYANTCDFLDIITAPEGLDLGPRHITVSTCGLPQQIRAFARRPRPTNLAISLHAPNDALRQQLMPIGRAYPLAQLLEALHEYADSTGQKLLIEYVMLQEVNDGAEQALELAQLLRGLPCTVNLIPYNETAHLQFSRSSKERTMHFYDLLKQQGMSVTLRKELGAEAKAACGQLRAEILSQPPEQS